MYRRLTRLVALVMSLSLLLTAGVVQARPPRNGTSPAPLGAKKSSKLQTSQTPLNQMAAIPAREPSPAELKLAERMRRQAPTPSFKPDELIVKLKPGVAAAEVDALRRNSRASVAKTFRSGAQLWRLPKGSDLQMNIAALERSGKLEYVQPNFLQQKAAVTPNDPIWTALWGLENTGQDILGTLGVAGVDIDAPGAWELTMGDEDLVVGIIDTGVDFNHPDLAGIAWTNPGEICGDGIDNDGNTYIDDCNGYDFYNDDGTVFDAFDGDEHGTHVAGTIAAAYNNSLGVAGIAPNVKIMSLKFLGPAGGYTADAIEALEYAASFGVKITNNSWGGGPYEQALVDAIENSGGLFVVAAGNDGMNIDENPVYPASYTSPNLISVAAVNNQGNLSPFSNYGAGSVDVAAPGVHIVSTVPALRPDAAAIANNTGTYKSMLWGFGLEDLDSATAQDAVQRTLSFLGAATDTPILVVLDDESNLNSSYLPSMEPYFQSALTGYTAVTYVPVPAGTAGPDLAQLSQYPVVIWTTGRGWGNGVPQGTLHASLLASDVTNLTSYLDGGGSLFLTGQDALWSADYSVEYGPFVTNYLGAHLLQEGDRRPVLEGVPGSAFDGVEYDLGMYVPDDVWRDQYAVTDGHATAGAALTYYPYGYGSAYSFYNGTSMATPHVTGVAALVMSHFPDLTIQEVKDRIMQTVKPMPETLSGLVQTGGMANALNALSVSPDNDIPGVPFPHWGATVEGTLDGDTWADLDDVFYIDLEAGDPVQISLTGAVGTDFDLYVFGPTATSVNNVDQIMYGSENFGSDEFVEFTAPSDGRYYIDAFAFQGVGGYSLTAHWGFGLGCYEEDHEGLSFYSNWEWSGDGTGNAWMESNEKGASVEFEFYGDTVELYGYTAPHMGIGTVYIDGVQQPDVSFWSATPAAGQLVFTTSGLDFGVEHTIRIEVKGVRAPQGRKTAISIGVDRLCVTQNDVPPAPLTDLHADAFDLAVLLRWQVTNTEPDFVGYNVYRSTTSGGPYEQVNTAPVTAMNQAQLPEQVKRSIGPTATQDPWISFWDETVTNGLDYYYVVRAVDAAGLESENSPEAWAHPDVAPAAPTGVYAVNGDGSVTLAWTPNTEPDVVEYVIFRQVVGTGAWEFVGFAGHDPNASELVLMDTGVTNETEYEYEIYANDEWGVPSGPTYVFAHPSAAPAAPVIQSAVMDQGSVSLSWTANTESDFSHYNLVRHNPDDSHVSLGMTEATTFEESGLPDYAGVYTYYVYAVDIYGVQSSTYETLMDNVEPAQPTGLQATAGDGQVSLSWNANTELDVLEYVVDWYSAADPATIMSEYTAGTSTTITGLTNGQTYHFELYAMDEGGNVSTYASAQATPTSGGGGGPVDPPAAPTNLQASAGNGVINLSWDASTGASGYEVYVGTGSTEPTSWSLLGSPATNSYVASGLTNGTTYWFKVLATNSGGDSGFAGPVYAMPNQTTSVNPGLYQQNSTDVQLVGVWTTANSSNYSGGSLVFSSSEGAAAKFTFYGTGVELLAIKNPYYGIAVVYLDGVEYATVDFYSATTMYQTVVVDISGLTIGVHEVRVVRTGEKNPAAANANLNVDAFKIE